MKIIGWILGTIVALFIAGQIFITNEILSSVLYNAFYFGGAIIFIVLYIFITYRIVKLLGYDYFGSKFNEIGYFLIILFVLIGLFIANYLTGINYKNNLKDFSIYLSNHIEVREGQMPIFHIGDNFIKN